MAADEIEMQAVVLQMLQQQRMVQRQLELVLQEMNLLLDENASGRRSGCGTRCCRRCTSWSRSRTI
jgi:hypothetical protein